MRLCSTDPNGAVGIGTWVPACPIHSAIPRLPATANAPTGTTINAHNQLRDKSLTWPHCPLLWETSPHSFILSLMLLLSLWISSALRRAASDNVLLPAFSTSTFNS